MSTQYKGGEFVITKKQKKEIAEYVMERKRRGSSACGICPFMPLAEPEDISFGVPTFDNCQDKFCGTVWPRYKKLARHNMRHPCDILSKSYIKRSFRKWLNR